MKLISNLLISHRFADVFCLPVTPFDPHKTDEGVLAQWTPVVATHKSPRQSNSREGTCGSPVGLKTTGLMPKHRHVG